MEVLIGPERESAALRRMLELLDQIEALHDEAAYSEAGERQIEQLRAQWTKELGAAEGILAREWYAAYDVLRHAPARTWQKAVERDRLRVYAAFLAR